MHHAPTRASGLVMLALLAAVASGCASSSLNQARREYHSGDYRKAAETLEKADFPERDRVLFMMERGMIRQAAEHYDDSTKDFLDAYETLEEMTAISVTKDTASMVINDNVQNFHAVPFERTLLHTFTAKNHLLQSNWENAAVEARRIIQSLSAEAKKDYPDDAYSRYMAGFCLSMIGDWSNAALQFREAGKLLPALQIDERTGLITPGTNAPASPTPGANTGHELVVFALIGRSPTGQELHNQRRPIMPAGFAEIVIDGQTAGRSYALTDTADLAFTTKQKDAIRDMAKTVSRIALKEATAYQLDKQNELVGALYRIIMIGLLEQPDVRRWETLPRSLQVARVPCPTDPQEIQVRFVHSPGGAGRTLHLKPPYIQNRNTRILVVRDTQPVL